jgi:hypothetical protein
VQINENYDNYVPPTWVKPCVARLLASLPSGYLSGVEAIVLTNASTQAKTKVERKHGRKSRVRNRAGHYMPATTGRAACITLVVDTILGRGPGRARRLGFVQDTVVGRVLYHEVGHHLDATMGAPARTGEAAADAWADRLIGVHLEKTYPRFGQVAGFLARLVGPFVVRFLNRKTRSGRPN